MFERSTIEKLEFFKVLEYISKHTVTETGKIEVLNLLPLHDSNKIKRQGKFVNEAKNILIKHEYPPLVYLSNLYEPLSRSNIEGTSLKKNEIIDIRKLLETSRKVLKFLKTHAEFNSLEMELADKFYENKALESEISKVFSDAGEINDNASFELREIRRTIISKTDSLRKVINGLLKRYKDTFVIQEGYITQRDGRFVLPVKVENKRQIKGFIHSESATGQTVYIEPEETLHLNNDILSLHFAEQREIERILKNLTSEIGKCSQQLIVSLRYISELDSIFARAKYSIQIDGSFPEIDENKPFRILDARHPILLKKVGREKTVPLNLEIKNNNIIVITGPNAGGKTVVLKTAGLLSIMALAGIHIPAFPDTNIHPLKNILLDIGDEQSIEDDLSTFSSHLMRMKNILENADKYSLVLIDEIGTGTDPTEGSALAAAFLITLQKFKAKVLATTHHGNLKMIANNSEGFENASMEYDTDNLRPTYKFKQGIPGSSFAFEVAERIGLEHSILELAKEHVDLNKTKIEEFLIDLEKKSNQLQFKLNNLEIENTRLKGLTTLYENQIKELNEKKKAIVDKTRVEAELYLKDINKQVESVIKNIKESNAKKDVIVEEKKKIEVLKQKNIEIQKKAEPISNNHLFSVGDYVQLNGTTTSGEIIEINLEKNKAMIASGSLKLQVKIDKLLPAKKRQMERISNYSNIQIHANYSIDIRGLKPEEAEFKVIKFIDDASSAGLNSAEIIHGKGTGVLKQMVKKILENHSAVQKFYYANIEAGGEGATIVELK